MGERAAAEEGGRQLMLDGPEEEWVARQDERERRQGAWEELRIHGSGEAS